MRVGAGLTRIRRASMTGVLVLVAVAAGGVMAAALLRPDLEPPSADAERTSATGVAEDGTISLESLGSPNRSGRPRQPQGEPPPTDPPPRPVEVIGVGTDRFSDGVSTNPDDVDGYDPAQAEVATDDEIRSELADFRDNLEGIDPRSGARAYIDRKGRAVLPEGAPRSVALVVAAANEIATKPYKWGGGHGAWKDSGYDCSGSVSFALAGARLLDAPMASGAFMRYGDPGRGRWISVYSSPGHMFMTVAGLRFDTSGQGSAGTRWQRGKRSTAGLTVRHPPRL